MNILIIDFIEESTKNIINYFTEKRFDVIHLTPNIFDKRYVQGHNISFVICTGSYQSLTDPNHDKIPEFVFELNVPMLCICYSAQLIAEKYGGTLIVKRMKGEKLLEDDTLVWTNFNVGIRDIDADILDKYKEDNLIASFKKNNILCVTFHPERMKEDGNLYNEDYLDLLTQVEF